MISRLLAAAGTLILGLALVVALARGARPFWSGQATRQALPVARAVARPAATAGPSWGTANGQRFFYESGVTDRAPETLLAEFKAQASRLPLSSGVSPALPGFPESPDLKTAVRWAADPSNGAAVPEALLVFGRNPTRYFRMRLSVPDPVSLYRPLDDLERRMGVRGLSLGLVYGLADASDSWVFIGQDPATRILTPSFAATLARGGWSEGLKGHSAGQALACFGRREREVCFLRGATGALMVSSGVSGAIFAGNIAGVAP